MPTRVINENLSIGWHRIYEREISEVADMDDIRDLEEKIFALREAISGCATANALKSQVAGIKREFEKIDKRISVFAERMASTLNEGQWKKTFSRDIENALGNIERRYSEINAELDKKMSQVALLENTKERIRQIFIEQEEKIKTVIRESGTKLKKEIDENLKKHDILEILKKESQIIKWEQYK